MGSEIRRAVAGLSLAHLRHFQLVALHGSIREAADQAFRTQPAVSLSIKEMENRLGAPLFDRDRAFSLTPIGSACLPLIAEFLLQHTKLCDELERLATGQAGKVKFGSIPIPMVKEGLGRAVAALALEAPGIELTLVSDNARTIVQKVRAGELDVGVVSRVPGTEELDFQPLAQEPYGILCPASHPLAERSSMRWKDVEEIPLIRWTMLGEIVAINEVARLRMLPLEVSSLETLLTMVEHGLGVSVVPRYALPRESKTLRFIPLEDPLLLRTIGLVKSRQFLHPAAARFTSILLQFLTSDNP